jgi:hypothetical protein
LHRGPGKAFQIHIHARGSRKTPCKERGRRNWVLGHGGRRFRPKSGELAARVAGEKGGETTRDSPRLDLGAWLGEKRLPAGWTAAPGGGRRWSSCSGEPPAEEEQRAARLALRWSRAARLERGKSFGRHSPTSGFKRGLTVSLTKGWPQGCVDLVKGFNRVCWRGF